MSFINKIATLLLLCGFVFTTGFKMPDENDDKTGGPDPAAVKAQKLFGSQSRGVLRLSVNQCVQRALMYNPELHAADYSIKTAEEKKVEVSKIGKPIFDYEYDLGPVPRNVQEAVSSFFSGNISVLNKFKVGMAIPIETFGKVKTGQALADIGISSELEKKVLKKSDIVLKVKQLYYGILFGREIHHLLQSAHDSLSGEINKREAQGGTDPTELLKLKLFRADLEKKIEEADKKEILAREALRVQLGLDSETRLELASDKLQPLPAKLDNFEAYRSAAMEERMDLKLLDLGYEAKQQQVKLEKRLMAPNLAVGGFFGFARAPGVTGVAVTDDFNDPFNFTQAGLGFQLQGQFDYHAGFSKVRQAKSEVQKLGILKDYAHSGVELEVKEAFLDARNTQLDLNRAEEAGKLSRQLLFLTQSNNDIGLAEPKDLIDALSAFLLTRGQYFEAVFNYNVALAKLDQKIGRLPDGTENESEEERIQ